MSFIIYGLPRSRTFWLSRFLTYGSWRCGHDEIRYARSLDDIKSWFDLPNTGTIETAGAPYWRYVQQHFPHVKPLVIRRPVEDAINSCLRTGLFNAEILHRTMVRLDHKLDQIEQRLDVVSVQYDDLKSEETCKQIFEHCLPYRHDHDWWQTMDQMNLQINLLHLLEYFNAYQPQLTKLAKIAKYQMISDFNRKDPIDKDDGITIQQEDFDTSYADSKKLQEEHCYLSGEAPDEGQNINVPMMQDLEKRGYLQVTTARCNGRMFGYLVHILSPSLASKDILGAAQTTFIASKEFKGLGQKMERAAVEALRQKGVNEIYFHAGVRADGRRIGSLYKRLGAAEHGEMYKMTLQP